MNFSRLGFLFFLISVQLCALPFVQSTRRYRVCWSNSTFNNNFDQIFSTITEDIQMGNGFYNASHGGNLEQVDVISLCALVDGNNGTNGTEFNQVLATLLDGVITQAASGDSVRKLATGNASVSDSQSIYAAAQCTPDLSQVDCNDCLKNATNMLSQCCSGRLGARVLTQRCHIRYDKYMFYGPLDAIPPAPVGNEPVSPPVDSPVANASVPPPVDALPPFIAPPVVDKAPSAPPPQEMEQHYIESGEGNKNSRFQLRATVVPLMILQYYIF